MNDPAPIPETATHLTWRPEPGRQTVALRAAGLTVDGLKAAGYRWTRAGQWEAPASEAASAILVRLTTPSGSAGTVEREAKARPSGVQSTEEQAGTPPRELARRTAAAGRDMARLEKARETARGLAARLEARAEELSRPRETHTPKKLCYAMNAKLDGARNRRGAELLRAWAEDPSRLPDWRPNAEHAVRARRRETQSVANGWHNYLVETDKPEPSQDPTILALRAAYPDDARPDPRAEIDRLEAAIRFSPIPGFFPTPPSLIQRMMELADIREGQMVLEPSAGNGHLAEAARAVGAIVHCCEVVPALVAILKAKGLEVIGEDCMAVASAMSVISEPAYDRVLMNPPFERGQDREHIRQMFDMLKPGGRLVAVCSTGPFQRTHTADVAFREWLDRVGAEVEDVEPGAFAGSDAFRKTGVAVKLIIADKRGDA